MRTEKTTCLSGKKEEFADLLTVTGTKRNVARVLVFLACVEETTSREIEHGTGLSQPEVSIAIRGMMKKGWILIRESRIERTGRPVKFYKLAKPVTEVVESIGNEKVDEANHRLRLIRKLQECVRCYS